MKLSVLMPVYNEAKWLEKIVLKVLGQKVAGIDDLEIIIVDDGSGDGTVDIVKRLAKQFPQKISAFFHAKNMGKGAAVRTAVEAMTGEVCLIQDADAEYSPEDYARLLRPLVDGFADCVYGSRFAGSQHKRVLFFWHYVANKGVTLLSNMCTNLNLTDMETGYKAFRADLLKTIPIRSKRFGFEPEITAKIARRRARIFEVGISYCGRTYDEGKKITWVDGVKAVLTILRFWVINDSVKK
ncbi:MAG: glycosyltransferase family 2 protein [Candidatus Omnitrophota bacterium]